VTRHPKEVAVAVERAYDAVVIGGGIIGCSIAWRLAQTGRSVVVLERGHVGGEASSAAAGVLTPKATPEIPKHLLDFRVASNAMYPTFVEEVRATTGHAFEFRVSGHLLPGFTETEVRDLQASYALQAPAGIRAELVSGADALNAEPLLAPDVQAALYLPDHGFVDNPKLTNALGAAVRAAGGDVVENCLVTGVELDGDRVIGVATVTGTVASPIVVNCAGSWSSFLDPHHSVPVRPLKGEILAVDARPASHRILVSGPSNSAVPRADGRTIVCATSSDVGYNKDVVFGSIVNLFERTARLVPSLRNARFLEMWAGLRPMTPDREPVLGADVSRRGLYWATGHLGNGIVEAPATAQAVADLITTGKSSIPIDRFSPERFAEAPVGSPR
jgi:glycine oxidase